jgi:hypothetical protein
MFHQLQNNLPACSVVAGHDCEQFVFKGPITNRPLKNLDANLMLRTLDLQTYSLLALVMPSCGRVRVAGYIVVGDRDSRQHRGFSRIDL